MVYSEVFPTVFFLGLGPNIFLGSGRTGAQGVFASSFRHNVRSRRGAEKHFLSRYPTRFKMADKDARKDAIIKNADMSEDMTLDAIECAAEARDKFSIEKDIAA